MDQHFIRTYGRTRSRSLDDSIMIKNPNLYREIPKQKLEDFEQVHLEIGFGNGENIIYRSEILPNVLQIGVDVYKNGICKVLKNIKDNGKKNICVSACDARQFLDENNLFVDIIFIMFPDPWDKKSEKKREKKRLINLGFLQRISSYLKNNGIIVFASDHKDYYDSIKNCLISLNDTGHYNICEETSNEYPKYFNDMAQKYFIESNYEKKAISDRFYGVGKKCLFAK